MGEARETRLSLQGTDRRARPGRSLIRAHYCFVAVLDVLRLELTDLMADRVPRDRELELTLTELPTVGGDVLVLAAVTDALVEG